MKNKLIFLIVFISAIIQIFTWTTGHNWGGDFSAYIMQAISISDGTVERFVELNDQTKNLSSKPVGPVTYPWGFPILLSIAYSYFGFDIVIFKSVILIFFLALLVLLWFLYEKELDFFEKSIFVSIFAFNPFLLKFGDSVLSDIPFLFFSTLSIFILFKLEKKRSYQSTLLLTFILGLFFAAGFSLRSNGVFLPLTYIGIFCLIFLKQYVSFFGIFKIQISSYDYISKKIKPLIFLFPLIVFIIPSYYIFIIFPNPQDVHLNFLNKINLKDAATNILYYSLIIKDFFGPSYIGIILYVVSVPFAIIGFVKKWRSSSIVLIYIILTLSLYILWPFRQGLRFILPVFPFYIYFFIIGLRSLQDLNNNILFNKKILSSCFVLVFVLVSVFRLYENLNNEHKLKVGPYTKQSQEMFNFINNNVLENETVVFRKPRVMRLFTKRDSVFFNHIDDFNIREWFVVDKKNLIIGVSERDKLFEKFPVTAIFENNQFIIYRFK